jgi:chemotaxis protein histidine kinase CheA
VGGRSQPPLWGLAVAAVRSAEAGADLCVPFLGLCGIGPPHIHSQQLATMATSSLDSIDAGWREKLQDIINEAIGHAQTEVLSAKVPIGSYGRVKEAFDHLRTRIGGSFGDFVSTEASKLQRVQQESLQAQTQEMENSYQKSLTEKLESITAERDTLRAAEQAREKLAAEQQAAYQRRRDGTKEMLTESELELKQCEERAEKAEALVKQLEQKVAQAEEKLKGVDEDWDESLNASLALCTLQPKKEVAVQDPTTHLYRRNQRTVQEQMKSALEQFPSHGAQVKYLLSVYEEAKKHASAGRIQERHDAEKQLEEAKREVEAKEVERKKAEKSLDEARSTTTQSETKVETMLQKMESVHEEAREAARDEAAELDEKLKSKSDEYDELQRQLTMEIAKLKAETAAHQATGQKLAALTQQRLDESNAHTAKLAACTTALNAARSAAKNGGYYFSAAPIGSPPVRSPPGAVHPIAILVPPSGSRSANSSPLRGVSGTSPLDGRLQVRLDRSVPSEELLSRLVKPIKLSRPEPPAAAPAAAESKRHKHRSGQRKPMKAGGTPARRNSKPTPPPSDRPGGRSRESREHITV